jgi:hypothetical protein
VLLTAVAACAAAALVGLLFLLGVVEEAAFGSLGMAIDLDAWSQAWMGMTFFGPF